MHMLIGALAAAAAITAAPAPAQPTVTLDGGMFVRVGTVLSTSDPATATLPMALTWTSTGAASQQAWLNAAAQDDGPYLRSSVDLGPDAQQAVMENWASESNADTTGGVELYDSQGQQVGGASWGFQAGYAEAETLGLRGSWARANCGCWMGGDTWRGSRGDAVVFTVGGNTDCDVGSTVALVGDYAPTRGSAKILLDGVRVATVSEGHANASRVVVWQKRYKGYAPQTHTVRVVVTSGRFDVDGLERVNGYDYHSCGG